MLRFGEFALDPVGARLLRAGEPVDLQPKVYELLKLLLSEPGRLFGRAELEAALWPDVSVTEDSLSQAVRKLRMALGEESRQPRFLETVPKRGYRWVGTVVSEQGVVPGARRTLPRPEDAFFGRQAELEQLRSALSQSRLVSIVGPGGIGKTRLALALPEVTAWCRLGAAKDEPSLFSAVAEGLSLPPEAATDRGLRAALMDCSELVLLDEAEGVVEPLARAITDWQGVAGTVRFLVTSRTRLGLAAERCLELGPLSLPDGIALYAARAAAVEPDAADSEGEIRALVEALDGWPLAIELAAARRPLLDAATVRSRLRSSLEVLSRPRLDRPERHRSLSETLAWSWSLLSEPEQLAAARLSLFASGMTLQTAERVLSDQPDPLLLLEALRHRSWLQRSGDRFEQYTPLRQFASAQLDAMGLREDAVARFVEAMASRARELEDKPTAALAAERANLWAAFHATSEPDLALELGRALVRTDATSHEGWPRVRQAFDRLIALAQERPALQARALAQRARLWPLPQHRQAQEDARRALLLAGDDPQLKVQALLALSLSLPAGDPEKLETTTEAVRLCREAGYTRGLALSLGSLGQVLRQRGKALEALEAMKGSAEQWRRLGIGWGEARALLYLSRAALPSQDLELVYRSTLRALELLDPQHDAQLYADGLDSLAVLAWYEQRYEDASALLDQVEVIGRTTWLLNPTEIVRRRVEMAAEQGDLARARALLASLPEAPNLLARAERGFSELMVLVAERRWEEAERNTAWRADAFRETGYRMGEAGVQTWRALVAAAAGDQAGARRWSDVALGLMDASFGRIGQQYALLAAAAPQAAACRANDRSACLALRRDLDTLATLAVPGPTTGRPVLAFDVRMGAALLEEALEEALC